MKLLYVHGDDDYAALTFENDVKEEDRMALWEKSIPLQADIEFTDGCYCKAYDFGDVDPKFLEFLNRHILDYDHSKHTNFYILEG